jgi:threonine dehydratase
LAIVAGQATAVVELLEQHPDMRSLVIPVGGGGLLSGAIAARAHLGRPVHIVACEPANFASMAASVHAGAVVRLGRRATFADGLALNLEPGSVTLDIVAAADELTFRSVSEAEIAAAATAVFNREAVLIEGAAADPAAQ